MIVKASDLVIGDRVFVEQVNANGRVHALRKCEQEVEVKYDFGFSSQARNSPMEETFTSYAPNRALEVVELSFWRTA